MAHVPPKPHADRWGWNPSHTVGPLLPLPPEVRGRSKSVRDKGRWSPSALQPGNTAPKRGSGTVRQVAGFAAFGCAGWSEREARPEKSPASAVFPGGCGRWSTQKEG